MRKLLLFSFLVVISAVLYLGATSLSVAQGNAKLVGSDSCKSCHDEAFESYQKSIHAKKAIPGSSANKGGGAKRAMVPVRSISIRVAKRGQG